MTNKIESLLDINEQNSSLMISVIIPVYNGKQFIQNCVEAVDKLKNSHEIILIDDGSSDGSFEWMKDHFSEYPTCRIYHKENGGIVSARNFGMSKARGTFLFFADQDDLPVAETLDHGAEKCNRENSDIAVWTTIQNKEGVQTACDTVVKDITVNRKTIKEEIIPNYLSYHQTAYASSMGHVWGMLFRRDIVREGKLEFRRFVNYEDDYLFILDALLNARKVSFIKKTGYCWIRRQNSESSRLTYVDDIWNRYRNLYHYIFEKCRNYQITVPEEVYIYARQNSMIHSIENCSSVINSNRKPEIKQLKVHFRNDKIRGAFRKKNINNNSGRAHRIYLLLRHNLFDIATIYAYLDSIRQKNKK